jgi:hypothetical protein
MIDVLLCPRLRPLSDVQLELIEFERTGSSDCRRYEFVCPNPNEVLNWAASMFLQGDCDGIPQHLVHSLRVGRTGPRGECTRLLILLIVTIQKCNLSDGPVSQPLPLLFYTNVYTSLPLSLKHSILNDDDNFPI